MTKSKSRNLVLLGLVIIALIVAGAVIYATQKDETESTNSSQQKNCTTYDGKIAKQCAEDYIGLSPDEATDKAKKNNMQPLTVLVDGQNQGFTDIYRPAPIYFEVNNNTVTEAYFEHDRNTL